MYSDLNLLHSTVNKFIRKKKETQTVILSLSLILSLCIHCRKITANRTSIDAGVLQVSAPPLFDWGVSVSSYGAAILLSPNGVQTLTLERLRSREGAVEDYCYVCVRPSGRPAGPANLPAPGVSWSSPCAEVNAVNNCTLVFTAEGNVVLHEGVQGLWQTETEKLGVRRMELRDSGNLVLVLEGGEVVWQGFDHVPRSLGCRKEVEGGAERVRVGLGVVVCRLLQGFMLYLWFYL